MPTLKLLLFVTVATFHLFGFAQTTYSVTTPNYPAAGGDYTTSMNFSGSFTTAAPLPPNLIDKPIGPAGTNVVQSWSFFDGVNTFTPLNSSEFLHSPSRFEVSTDSNGNITAFHIALVSPKPPHTNDQPVNAFSITSTRTIQTTSGGSCRRIDVIDDINVCTQISVNGVPSGTRFDTVPVFTRSTASSIAGVPALHTWALLALAAALVLGASFSPLRHRA